MKIFNEKIIVIGYCHLTFIVFTLAYFSFGTSWQVIGCVYLNQLAKKSCWVIQLLSIICLQSANYKVGESTNDFISVSALT